MAIKPYGGEPGCEPHLTLSVGHGGSVTHCSLAEEAANPTCVSKDATSKISIVIRVWLLGPFQGALGIQKVSMRPLGRSNGLIHGVKV